MRPSADRVNPSQSPSESVCSEVYDLLQENDYTKQFKGEWLLYRASSNAPLREVRVRSFKPMVKNPTGEEVCYATLKIRPYVFDYDPDLRYANSATYNGFNLYNSFVPSTANPNSVASFDASRMQEYRVQFNPRLDEFCDDINNAISAYFSGFDYNGTFDFTNGSKHSYLTDYQGDFTCDSTDVDISFTRCKGLCNGWFIYSYVGSNEKVKLKICRPTEFSTATEIDLDESLNVDFHAVSTDKDADNVVLVYNDDIYIINSKEYITDIGSLDLAENEVVTYMCTTGRTVMITVQKLTEYDKIYVLDNDSLHVTAAYTTEENWSISSACSMGDKYLVALRNGNAGVTARNHIYIFDQHFTYLPDEVPTSILPNTEYAITDLTAISNLTNYYIGFDTYLSNKFYQIIYDSSYNGIERVWRWRAEDAIDMPDYVFKVFNLCHYFGVVTGTGLAATCYYIKTGEIDYQSLDYCPTVSTATVVFSPGTFKAIAVDSSKEVLFKKEQVNVESNGSQGVITINEYLHRYGTASTVPSIIKLHYNADNKELTYCHNVMFPLYDKVLMFAIEIYTEPISLLYTNTNEQIFKNIRSLGFSYLNPSIQPIFSFVYNYDEKIVGININSVEDYLVLCSPHMNNISQIIYAGETTATVVFKKIDTLPSANYLSVYLKNNKGERMDRDALKDVYGRIIVEIDYIYGDLA